VAQFAHNFLVSRVPESSTLEVEAKLAENRGKTWGNPAEMGERSADKPL